MFRMRLNWFVFVFCSILASVAQSDFSEESYCGNMRTLVRSDDLFSYREEALRDNVVFRELVDSAKLPEGELKNLREPTLSLIDVLGTDVVAFAARADLRDRGQLVLETLTALPAEDPGRFFDNITLGAGPAEVIGDLAQRAVGSTAKNLTIEISNDIANTFSQSGGFFSINSTNREDVFGQDVSPGVGNLNRVPNGAIQLSDVDPLQWPTGLRFGQIFQINRSFGKSDIVFGQRVLSVEIDGQNGRPRYAITIRDAAKGTTQRVWSENVVFTGLGVPNIPFRDASSLQFIAQEWGANTQSADVAVVRTAIEETLFDRASKEVPFDRTKPLPKILTFSDFSKSLATSNYPLLPFVNKRIAIVGFGDSGKVSAAFLTRIADSLGYGGSVAQLGSPAKIYAIGETANDCIEYINNNRVRYAQIAGGIKAGKIVPVNLRAQSVGPNRITVADSTGGQAQNLDVDYVILATGFDSRAGQVLSSITGGNRGSIENDPSLQLVNADVPGRGQRPIAKQLPGERIFFTGAGANLPVAGDNIAGVPQNTVSVFINGPRVSTFYANNLPRNSQFQRLNVPSSASTTIGSNPSTITLSDTISNLTQNERRFDPSDQAKFEISMLRLVYALGLPAGTPELNITFQRSQNGNSAEVVSNVEPQNTFQAVVNRLDAEAKRYIGNGLNVGKTIAVRIPLTNGPDGGRSVPNVEALRQIKWVRII